MFELRRLLADPIMAHARFVMVGTRAAVLDGPTAEAIEQQLYAIENALASVPDFAFDLSKTLVESVCKTVLADMGQPADQNWDAPKLLKETTKRLSLLPRNHPNPNKANDAVEKTVKGLVQTIHGLCELRNGYGIASHGRDNLSARLDIRQATLAAQAADTIVSFLYRIHRDALAQSPGERVYYEDHADFNDAFDQENEPIRLGNLEFLPSRVLFNGDTEAYKSALNEHLAEQAGAASSTATATPSDDGEAQ